MFNVADKTAFCILSKTWVVFRLTSDNDDDDYYYYIIYIMTLG